MPFSDPECVEVVDTETLPTNWGSGDVCAPMIVGNGHFIHVGNKTTAGRFHWVAYDIHYDYLAGTFTSITETDIFNFDGTGIAHVNHNTMVEVWHFPDDQAFVCYARHNMVSADAFPNVTWLRRFTYDDSGVTAGTLIEHSVNMAIVGEDDIAGCPTSGTALLLGTDRSAGFAKKTTKSVNLLTGSVSTEVVHDGTHFQPGNLNSFTYVGPRVFNNGSGSSCTYLIRVSSTGTGSLTNAWYHGNFTGPGLGTANFISTGAGVPAGWRESITQRVGMDPENEGETMAADDGSLGSIDPFVVTTTGNSVQTAIPLDSANGEFRDPEWLSTPTFNDNGQIEIATRRSGASTRRLRRRYTYPGMVEGRAFWLGASGSTTQNIGYPVTRNPGYWFFWSTNLRLLRACVFVPDSDAEWRVGRVWWPLGEGDPG